MRKDNSIELLRDIAARASTLWELIDNPESVETIPADLERARIRLDRWQERSARLDPSRFEKRLSWIGAWSADLLGFLGQIRLKDPLPDWTRVFLAAMNAANPKERDAVALRRPFGPVLWPFAKVALEGLPPVRHSLFTSGALDALTENLLEQLAYIAEPALYLEFSVFRSEQTPSKGGAGSQTGLYEEFTDRMLEGGLWEFFSEYAVLARLLSTAVMFWSRNASEFIEALNHDRTEIERVFASGEPVGRVASVKCSLSDGHDGARTVTIVEFESGLKVVHKPRDIGIETAWFKLLDHLNKRGGEFHLLRVINRRTHGWAEVAEHQPCCDEREVKQFYARAGMLLCVLYALEASDCFYENIVACGAYPVLVDMETLMHHVLRRSSDLAPAEEVADDILFDSVFRAGFLPSWEAGPDGVCVDISGLSAKAGQVTPYLRRRWENMNTDAMVLHHERIVVDSERHLAQLNGLAVSAADYTEEIVSGFQRMYRILTELREELLAPGGSIHELGKQEIRVVIHATRIYSLLMKRLAAPRHLRSGVERSLETDIFSRFYLESAEKSRLWPVLDAEIRAMEQLDIPRFTVLANSHALALPTGQLVENAFEETALDRVRRRLLSFHSADMTMQAELIRASLRVSAISVRHERVSVETVDEPQVNDVALLSSEALLAEAASLAAEIESRMIKSPAGGATWIAPQLLPRASHHELRPLRMDLYNGLAGVALFFSALERISGTGARTALAALIPLRRFVLTATAERMARQGYTIGAATGLGSFIYALCRCARLLDEPSLTEDAERAVEQVTPEWIAADQYFDVMSGAAGLILGLLTLYKESGSAAAIEKAITAGNHLVSNRQPAGRGCAWRTVRQNFLTGFSHGAAGIALSLLRLHSATGEERFRTVAVEGMAFEDSVFDETEGNWPDFRHSDEQPSFMNAWCHGATGIGIARLSGRGLAASAEIERDIQAALRRASSEVLGEKDGLCCGNLGRAELLITAAAADADNGMRDQALRRASIVVERARASGGYRLSGWPGRDFFDPSLFQGLSGIGYELLRIANPDLLPSVLAWE